MLVAGAALFAFAVAACSESGQIVGAQWDLRSAPDDTRLLIRIGVGSGTCHSLEDTVVTERADQVDIEARVRETGGDCTADLRTADRTVTLSEPLGNRALTGCRPDGDVSAGGFSTITIPRGGDCRGTLPAG
jgi:hypothetical protein